MLTEKKRKEYHRALLDKNKAYEGVSFVGPLGPRENQKALVDDFMQERSLKKRLSITAKLTRQIYDSEKELMDILRGASVVAPEFKELEQEREKRRYERQGDYVKQMINEKSLAKELSLQKARDILWALTGHDMYRMLVVERN